MLDLKEIRGTQHFEEMDTIQSYKIGENDPACLGCLYYRHLLSSKGSKQRACHYSLDNHQCRPCPPGAGCTVKRPIKK